MTVVLNGWRCWRRSNVVLLAVLVTHLTDWLHTHVAHINNGSKKIDTVNNGQPLTYNRLSTTVHCLSIALLFVHPHYCSGTPFALLACLFRVFSCSSCQMEYSDTILCTSAILIFPLCKGIIRCLLYGCRSLSLSRITRKVVDSFRWNFVTIDK